MTDIVAEVIILAFRMEIANPLKPVGDNSFLVSLPNHGQVIITVKPLRHDPHYQPPTQPKRHTVHHNLQIDPNQPLTLLSIEDCRCYLDDVCQNLLDAEYHDGELTFPNGDSFLVTLMTFH